MLKVIKQTKIRNYLIILLLMSILPGEITSVSSEFCRSDADCSELNHCDKIAKKCVHDRIFTDFFQELFGLLLIVVGSALSNAGGIGGGGLLIPILLLVLKFYTHEAIPISKLMIFTGALTSFFLGFRQKHPFRNSITIDYNIPLLLVPMLLFGTMVGVTLNKITPPWIILVSLTAVLIINTYKTFKKGRKLYKEENSKLNVAARVQNESRNVNLEENNSISRDNKFFDSGVESERDKSSTYDEGTVKVKSNFDDLLKVEEKKDLVRFPLDKIVYMGLCYFVMLAINFLKGSDHVNSIIGVKLCSNSYWLIFFLYIPFAFVITFLVIKKIKREYEYRLSIDYPYNSSDIKWNNNIIFIKFPLFAFISGIMAGLLGIGGGLILGPLLLELGIHPLVSTATSNFLVLFTSSSTSIQFILLGMMNFDFGIACTIASTLGSYLGTVLIQILIAKTKRNSYLVLALAVVLGVSTILIPIHTLMEMVVQISEGKDIFAFGSPC